MTFIRAGFNLPEDEWPSRLEAEADAANCPPSQPLPQGLRCDDPWCYAAPDPHRHRPHGESA